MKFLFDIKSEKFRVFSVSNLYCNKSIIFIAGKTTLNSSIKNFFGIHIVRDSISEYLKSEQPFEKMILFGILNPTDNPFNINACFVLCFHNTTFYDKTHFLLIGVNGGFIEEIIFKIK